MFKRFLSIVVVFAMVFMMLPMGDARAATNRTKAEAIAWLESVIGKQLNPDGVYPGECVDLVMSYYDYMVGNHSGVRGNARDYATNTVPAGFTRIRGASPIAGDVCVSTAGTYGHVYIMGDNGYTYHSNYTGAKYVKKVANYRDTGFWGVIRPEFKGGTNYKGPTTATKNLANGYYMFSAGVLTDAEKTPLMLDVAGGSGADFANINIYSTNGTNSQIFKLTGDGRIYTKASDYKKCVDTQDDGKSNGKNVIQYATTNAQGQKWHFHDAGNGYVFISSGHEYCLDAQSYGKTSGTNVCVWTSNQATGNDITNQRWLPIPVSGNEKETIPTGQYVVVSKSSNKNLAVESGSKNLAANIIVSDSKLSQAQVFNIGEDGTRECSYIENAGSGLRLDKEYNEGDGNVIQYENNGIPGQSWIFESAGSGYYYIRNQWGKYLQVESGQNVGAYTYSGTDGQKWKILSYLPSGSVSGIYDRDYTGDEITQSVSVSVNGNSLTQGVDYEVSYKNNIKPGTATIIIEGTGEYIGKVERTFEILPSDIEDEDEETDEDEDTEDDDEDADDSDNDSKEETDSPKPLKKGSQVSASNGKYKVTVSSATKGEVTYTGTTNKNLTTISVPDSIKVDGITYKVTKVDSNAFKSNTKLASVTIGKNIKSIGKNAFYGCKNLKEITVKASAYSLKTIGNKAFYGVKSNCKITIYAKNKTQYNKAVKLIKNSKVKKVKYTYKKI